MEKEKDEEEKKGKERWRGRKRRVGNLHQRKRQDACTQEQQHQQHKTSKQTDVCSGWFLLIMHIVLFFFLYPRGAYNKETSLFHSSASQQGN